MAAALSDEDPEPSDRFPAGPLYVPVRPGPVACAAHLFRTPLGDRTAVGFTSQRRLTTTLGADQPWIRLAEPALRALVAPLGVTTVMVDPQFSAPAPTFSAPAPTAPSATEHTEQHPQAVEVPSVTGAAALLSAPAGRIGGGGAR